MGFQLTPRLGDVCALTTEESCRGDQVRRIGARAAVKGFRLVLRLREVGSLATDEEFCPRRGAADRREGGGEGISIGAAPGRSGRACY